MTWAKIDDQFHAHRKAKRAWMANRGTLGLHLLAVSYCAGQLTDGLVDDEFVLEKLPNSRERAQVTGALENAGLWLREDDGWRINDWLEYNPSREDVLGKRARDAERKARRRSADASGNPAGVRAESNELRRGVREPRAGVVPTRPDPTHPKPLSSTPDGGDEMRADVLFLCELLAEQIRTNDLKAHPNPRQKAWTVPGRLLLDKDGREPAEIERVIRWCQAHEFWRANILSMGALRKQYSRLLLQMQSNSNGQRTGHDESARRSEALRRMTEGASA